MNAVDEFLEEKVVGFLSYSCLGLHLFEKAIETYEYKKRKMGLSKIETYNLKMSQVYFNWKSQNYTLAEKILKHTHEILSCRIDIKL